MRSSIIIAGTAVVLAAGIALPAWSAGGQTDEVTFTKDIAPILQRSCQHCHRPDSIAPMSLLTYEETRPWARAIKQRTSPLASDPVTDVVAESGGGDAHEDDVSQFQFLFVESEETCE